MIVFYSSWKELKAHLPDARMIFLSRTAAGALERIRQHGDIHKTTAVWIMPCSLYVIAASERGYQRGMYRMLDGAMFAVV